MGEVLMAGCRLEPQARAAMRLLPDVVLAPRPLSMWRGQTVYELGSKVAVDTPVSGAVGCVGMWISLFAFFLFFLFSY